MPARLLVRLPIEGSIARAFPILRGNSVPIGVIGAKLRQVSDLCLLPPQVRQTGRPDFSEFQACRVRLPRRTLRSWYDETFVPTVRGESKDSISCALPDGFKKL